MTESDVLIVGAGPAGSVAAYVLARAGRRVLLVDTPRHEGRKLGESLPGAARPLLHDMGLLPLVDSGPHVACCGNVSVWGSSEPTATDFIRDPHGPGWHLDRSRFDSDLCSAAQDAGAVFQERRWEAASRCGDRWRVRLNGLEIETGWLIDATGRRAAVARHLGVRRRRDDSLIALYAWFTSSADDVDIRTFVEAGPHGWWYTARLPDETRIVVFHVDASEAGAILRDPDAWERLLAQTVHVRSLIAGRRLLTNPRGTEACGARLDHFSGPGWLAAGDAALSFDPLSSQGIFTALYAGMRAGATVNAALSGDTRASESYAASLESVRAAYVNHHALFYRMERRWPDHPFWQRRHARGAHVPTDFERREITEQAAR